MRFTHLKEQKQDVGEPRNPGPCYGCTSAWAHGCSCLGVQGKPGPFRAAAPTATGDPSEGAEPTAECGTTSLLLGGGQGAASQLLSPVTAIHRKGGLAAQPRDSGRFPSPAAKRSLDIPGPPRIRIYTVPARRRGREGEGETRGKAKGQGKCISFRDRDFGEHYLHLC